MATLITPLNSLRRDTTAGERRFATRLEALLEDDYLCWYDVPIGPKRLRPDFVILHPSRGLLILEVKDWKLDTIKAIDKHSAEIMPNGVPKTVANPLEQARSNALHVIDKLSADPQLAQAEGPHQGKLCMPWGYGVVLTNITRQQFDARLTEEEQDLVLPGRLIICKDEMLESTDAMDFQERLWGMFHYSFGQRLTLPQIERVRWHLFPEIRIQARQQELFASPSDATNNASTEATLPELIRVFDLPAGTSRTESRQRAPRHSWRRRLGQDTHSRLPMHADGRGRDEAHSRAVLQYQPRRRTPFVRGPARIVCTRQCAQLS
jgi:hypothetical protein